MKFAIALLLAILLIPNAVAQEVSKEERKEGFVPLFNGKNFEGWRFTEAKKDGEKPANWSVADDMIRLSDGASRHLATQWDYEDFEMRVQWKASKKGSDSGLFLRSGREVNANRISLAQADCGRLVDGPKDAKAVPELQKEAGEWNDWRLRAEGSKLTLWANGKQAWESADFKPARGYLGLQAKDAAIDFKNIRIKELGFESLDTAKWRGDNRKPVKDMTVMGKNRGLETIENKHTNYVLRVEYKATKNGTLRFGYRNALLESINDAKVKAEYPAGQWNHLEIRVHRNQSSVWLNGVWLWENTFIRNAAAEGVVAIGTDGDAITFRNARIKAK